MIIFTWGRSGIRKDVCRKTSNFRRAALPNEEKYRKHEDYGGEKKPRDYRHIVSTRKYWKQKLFMRGEKSEQKGLRQEYNKYYKTVIGACMNILTIFVFALLDFR